MIAICDKVIFPVFVMKVQRYTLSEIFEKKLYFLLPFYIFSHEKELAEYEADEKKLELLKEEYATLMSRLEALELDGHISAYNRSLIVMSSRVVLSHIAAKYHKVKSEVKRVMGGRILDYEAKQIREDERRKFEEEKRKLEEEKRKNDELRLRNTVETVRNIMKEFKVTLEKAMSVANVAACDQEAVKAAITSA